MPDEEWVEPSYKETRFNCPHCGAIAGQTWVSEVMGTAHTMYNFDMELSEYEFTACGACGTYAIWCDKQLIYPTGSLGPKAHDNMPEDVRSLFEEARAIHSLSPRATAAILRLCVDKLCDELGASGTTLNEKIGSLVSLGLPNLVQKALDGVRVVGNNAVHPGEIIASDDAVTVTTLFQVVNYIVDRMITPTKQIEELYEGLPNSVKDSIQRRDGVTDGGE